MATLIIPKLFCSSSILSKIVGSGNTRLTVHIFAKRNYREIVKEEQEKKTVIKGIRHDFDTGRYVPPAGADTCPLRSRGIQITPEDVLILRQFVTSEGRMMTRDETGLCQREYFKVTSAVMMAQRENLLPGEQDQHDEQGNFIPKLNRHLTRYDIGSRSAIYRRGLWYRRRWMKVGDRRMAEDAPQVGRRRLKLNH